MPAWAAERQSWLVQARLWSSTYQTPANPMTATGIRTNEAVRDSAAQTAKSVAWLTGTAVVANSQIAPSTRPIRPAIR